MGYTLPLRFIKVSENRSDNRQFDVSVCATRIVAMMSTNILQARKTISDERKNGTLINAAGLSKAKTAIFLDNGSVVASPLSVKRLMSAIGKANDIGSTKRSKSMKIYEVEEPEPGKDDEQIDDLASYYENDFEEDLEEEYDE